MDKYQPGKIVVLGAGKIGLKFWMDSIQNNSAKHVDIWNRSESDEVKNLKGKNHEINQAALILHEDTAHFKCRVGAENLKASLKGAEIIVISAGAPRKVGEPRSALIEKNWEMMENFGKAVAEVAPNAIVVNVGNPVDAMTQLIQEYSGLPAEQIIGGGGLLDTSRLKEQICFAANVNPAHIRNAYVLGQHGESMVPVIANAEVKKDGKWQALSEVLANEPDKLEQIKTNTIGGGAIINKLCGHSAYIAPAAMIEYTVAQIIKAKQPGYQPTEKDKFIASVWSEEHGVYIGQQIQLQPGGTYKVVDQPELSKAEHELFKRSVQACRNDLALVPGRAIKGLENERAA